MNESVLWYFEKSKNESLYFQSFPVKLDTPLRIVGWVFKNLACRL